MLGLKRAVFTRTLLLGARGDDVRQLQQLLRSAGFDPGPADGIFGAKTDAAVRAFQGSRGLAVDGKVGPMTLAALTAAPTNGGGPPAGTAATGLSLHIGINRVDSSAYGFQVPELAGCVNDANDMQEIARSKGFRPRRLLDGEATSAAVVSSIEQAASTLQPGSIFLITYSGHGSQIPDPNEPDGRSETWVLSNRQLIDDELYALWGRFRAGVRILVISDSCHSGTVTRQLALINSAVATVLRMGSNRALGDSGGDGVERAASLVAEAVREFRPTAALRSAEFVERARLLAEPLAFQDAANRETLYRDELQRAAEAPAPVAKVLLISGCQDNQTSSDGRPDPSGHQNGAFTKALRNVWESAADYRDLYARIQQQMPTSQSPNLFWATERDAAFEAQRPFMI
jgi:hypothetical protein